MTHRQISPTPRRVLFPRVTVRHLKVTSGVLSIVLAGLAGGIAYTSSTDTEPSPTLAIETPARPELPDYRDGGLLSVAPTPNPVPPVRPQSVPEPAVVYEPNPEPVPVHIPPPSPPTVVLTVPPQPPTTVVREVPVPVQVEPRQDDKREDQERHYKHKREQPEKTTTTPMPPDKGDAQRPEWCIGELICVRNEPAHIASDDTTNKPKRRDDKETDNDH